MKNRMNGNGNNKPVEPEGLLPHAKKALDVEHYARRIIMRYGPFLSLGREHWKWNGSIWKATDLDRLRKHVVAIQPTGSKSCILTDNILRMVSNLTQADPDYVKWRSAVFFDSSGDIRINLANGMLCVSTKELARVNVVEPDAKDYVTAQLPCDYNAKATCPTFDYVLASTLPDERDRLLLQCYVGYCLVPDHRFQCVLYCYGAPNSGKSLLIYHGIGSMFGKELTSNVSLDKICRGSDELRRLETTLINVSTEINSHRLEDSSIFNQIACGEALDIALKYQKTKRLVPNAKNLFIDNSLPKWDRGSEAQARRMKILFFPKDFSEETKDGKLEQKIRTEGSGILNWALTGLSIVLGLTQMPTGSDESQLRMDQFKANNNPMGTFNKSYVSFNVSGRITGEDYRSLFFYWCANEGISVKCRDTSKLLKKLNPHVRIKPTTIDGKSTRVLIGLKLNEKGMELMREMRSSKCC